MQHKFTKLFCLLVVPFLMSFALTSNASEAACRKVQNEQFIKINPASMRVFRNADLSRDIVFRQLQAVAKIETSGCWAGVTGNFDGQLASVGVLQWNYGQNSIQPLLRRYKKKLRSSSGLRLEHKKIMPKYGDFILSVECTKTTNVQEIKDGLHPCMKKLLDPVNPTRLKADVVEEYEKLFESNAMVQIQMDYVVREMDRAVDFSKRMFGSAKVSELRFHWILDILVQQGGFRGLDGFKKDAQRGLAKGLRSEKHKLVAMKGILLWYAGHSFSPDQDGIRCDWRYNLEKWGELIQSGEVTDEQFELFMMSWLRARTASGQRGRWQALAFQRRAKIALGTGSVAHSSVLRDNNYACKPPSAEDYQSVIAELSKI